MKDILIIAHFTQVPGEKGNSRFPYLANLLVEKNYSVEIVTSSFSHRNKDQRIVTNEQLNNLKYKLTLLYERGYKRNISISRFYSHNVFGDSLKRYLMKRKKPDLIYCAVPSLDSGYVAAKYAQKNNVPFIIDIQDLWPEAFKMIFDLPYISDLIFMPFQKKANYIYNTANSIIAVSETYKHRGLSASKSKKRGLSVYLGTDLDYFDSLAAESDIIKPDNEIWLAYIGTLGHSYDLTCVIDALSYLQSEGIKNIKFIVMGDGPLKDKFINYAEKKNINFEFTGRLDYTEMVKILIKCDIAVNPISKGAAASIINKVGDYAAAGLPVLNTQESEEYRNLLESYQAGINCKNNDYMDLARKIRILYNNKNLRKKLGSNNRLLSVEKFDRKITYTAIVKLIQEVLIEGKENK